jgi:hypothetical protein
VTAYTREYITFGPPTQQQSDKFAAARFVFRQGGYRGAPERNDMSVTRRSATQVSIGPRHDVRRQPADQNAGGALRFAAAIAAAGIGFLIVAALWVSTCTQPLDMDTAACGVPQRTVLGLGAPLILLAGAVYAFVAAYRAWRARTDFWSWQGAGWFLFTVMLVTLAMGFPALAGPAIGG